MAGHLVPTKLLYHSPSQLKRGEKIRQKTAHRLGYGTLLKQKFACSYPKREKKFILYFPSIRDVQPLPEETGLQHL